MIKLYILSEEFPVIGQCKNMDGAKEQNPSHGKDTCNDSFIRVLNSGCSNPQDSSQCGCPQRTAVPLGQSPSLLPPSQRTYPR